MNLNLQTNTNGSGEKRGVVPSCRLIYRLNNNVSLELEARGEWITEEQNGVTDETTTYYLNTGYRAVF